MFKNLFTPDFIRELDDAYYAKFPEEWEQGDFFVDAPVYLSILAGETDRFARPRQKGDGMFTDTYTFSPAGVGCLKLVKIKPDSRWFGPKEDELIFEKVEPS